MTSAPAFKVLIADDSAEFASRVAQLLCDAGGIEPVIATSASEALERYHQLLPDTVVLDVLLRDGFAADVLRAMRADGRNCPILMVSNNEERSIRERCLADGATHFLSKQMEFERVIELIVAKARPARL